MSEEELSAPIPPKDPRNERLEDSFNVFDAKDNLTKDETFDYVTKALERAFFLHPRARIKVGPTHYGKALYIEMEINKEDLEEYREAHRKYVDELIEFNRSPAMRKKDLEAELRITRVHYAHAQKSYEKKIAALEEELKKYQPLSSTKEKLDILT